MSGKARVDQLVGHYDDDSGCYVLTGWSPGPAGMASVPLANGRVVVDIDFAEPGTVSRIEVIADDRALSDDAIRALESLTFVPGWRARLESVGTRPRIVWKRERAGMSSRPELGGAGVVGRLALLLAEKENSRRSGLARGMAALDAAEAAAFADPDLQLAVDPVALWDEAIELIARTDDGNTTIDERQRSQLETQLTRSAGVASDFDERVSRELDRLTVAVRGWSVSPTGSVLAAAALVAAGAPVESSPDLLVAIDPDIDVHAFRAGLLDGVLRVEARGTSLTGNDVFLRVFKRDTPAVPLALVPFSLENGDDPGRNGLVLVPREVAASDLLVELTTQPGEPLMTPFVRQVTRAVRSGQDASRLARRGDDFQARQHWRRCANEWRELADERRANLADAYAAGGPIRRTDPFDFTDLDDGPLGSDLVD